MKNAKWHSIQSFHPTTDRVHVVLYIPLIQVFTIRFGRMYFQIIFIYTYKYIFSSFTQIVFSSVQSLSRVRLFVTPWITACQASLSITNSWSSLKLTSIESVMPSNHLILCHPFCSCLQSFPALGSFSMSQFFESGGQILDFQLQHRSFQWIFRTDFV